MGALFTAASSHNLLNSATPITAVPISVGAWVNLSAAANAVRSVFSISDTATTNNYWYLGMSTAELMQVGAAAGGAAVVGAVTTALVAGSWTFVLGRFIAADNRRISVLHPTGVIEHGQNTTSTAPTGIDAMSIGALQTSAGTTQPWDGSIAEIWWTNTDIHIENTQTNNNLVMRLAYGGPFSVPHVAQSIVEYRSFRSRILSTSESSGEVYFGRGRQTWTNTGPPTLARHPPLPGWYGNTPQAANDLRRKQIIWNELLRGATAITYGGGLHAIERGTVGAISGIPQTLHIVEQGISA